MKHKEGLSEPMLPNNNEKKDIVESWESLFTLVSDSLNGNDERFFKATLGVNDSELKYNVVVLPFHMRKSRPRGLIVFMGVDGELTEIVTSVAVWKKDKPRIKDLKLEIVSDNPKSIVSVLGMGILATKVINYDINKPQHAIETPQEGLPGLRFTPNSSPLQN